MRRRHS
jgi:hypothetical protein